MKRKKQVSLWCIVPECSSTNTRNPSKLFIYVPYTEPLRSLWIKAAKRKPSSFSKTSCLFVCQDHFNLEEDMENYMKFKLMGGIKKMKPGVVPHIFEEDQKGTIDTSSPKTGVKHSSSSVDNIIQNENLYLDMDITVKEEDLTDETFDNPPNQHDYNCAETIKEEIADNELPTNNPDDAQETYLCTEDLKDIKIKLETIVSEEIDIKCETDGTYFEEDTSEWQQYVQSKHDCDKSCNCKCKQKSYPFQCIECKKSFARNNQLQLHMKSHTGEKPFKCKVCEKSFARNCDLNIHVRRHIGDKPYECNVCAKGFVQHAALQAHLRIHTGEKPFECNLCDKKFVRNSQLTLHMKTHTGENLFKCGVCEKQFVQNGRLRLHMKSHSGEKPYECRVCKKKFVENYNLQIHIRTHTGEKPFECDICKKNFVQNSHLQRHLTTHTGEKKFECNLCNKKFAQNSYLQLHMSTHTGEKPFKCDMCEKSFARNSYLYIHLNTHL